MWDGDLEVRGTELGQGRRVGKGKVSQGSDDELEREKQVGKK